MPIDTIVNVYENTVCNTFCIRQFLTYLYAVPPRSSIIEI